MKKICSLFLSACLFFATTAVAADLNQVAALVNGQIITVYDVHAAAKPTIHSAKLSTKKTEDKEKIRTIYKQTLEDMIMNALVRVEANKQNIVVAPQDVEAEITSIMQKNNLTKEALTAALARDGMTPDNLREKISTGLYRQKLMGMMVGRMVVVTPEEVRAYYDENQATMMGKRAAHIAIIVYPDSVNAPSIAKQLASKKNEFSALTKKISIGPNKERGGDLGLVPLDKISPQWVEMIEKMQPGDISPIFILQGKKAQFKLIEEPIGGTVPTFEEAKPIIENMLRQPKLQARFEDYVKQLRSKAIIEQRYTF